MNFHNLAEQNSNILFTQLPTRPGQRKPYVKGTRRQIDERAVYHCCTAR